MSGGRPFSPARLRSLIAHICSQPDRNFDVQKLMWIVFWADMEAYRQLGRSLTGATWVKTEWGPMPMRKKEAAAVDKSGQGPQA